MAATEWQKKKAKELLDELDECRGPQDLENWNFRAMALIAFSAGSGIFSEDKSKKGLIATEA